MASEKEMHLIKLNEQLKKRIRDMEELFAEQDDDNRGRLEELMQQKKELKAKTASMESRMFQLAEENAELKETLENLPTAPVQQQPVQPASNLLSESFVSEYHDLQDKVDQLNKEKITLQSKIRELQKEIADMVERLESLESTNADLTDALSTLNKENKRLSLENKDLAESLTMMQMEVDAMSNNTFMDQNQHGNSLFGEVDAAREKAEKELKQVIDILQKTLASHDETNQQELEQSRKRNAELEQEVVVLRKTLTSHSGEDRRKIKDVECMRESMKAMSEKNKELQKELDRRMDIEAEHVALKSVTRDVERQNELLKAENDRLKKQFTCAESRANENAHLLSKAETARMDLQLAVAAESRTQRDAHLLSSETVSQFEFNRGVQGHADRSRIQSTPRPVLKHRTASLPRSKRVPFSDSTLKSETSPPKDIQVTRKRGILLDYSEPVDRKRLDFKLQKLSDSNRDRQLHHLKSHYDPSTGTYDQSHGESPKSAAKLTTPTRGNKFLTSILRQ